MRTFGQQNLLLAFHQELEYIDLIIARENTEGFILIVQCFWAGRVYANEDMALSVRKIAGIQRLAALLLPLLRSRRKITVVHKANVFRVSDGLFLDTVRGFRDEFQISNMKGKLLTLWLRI